MEILDHYQPVEAMVLCFTICVLTGIFFGLFLLFINMKKSGMLGIAVSGMLECLQSAAGWNAGENKSYGCAFVSIRMELAGLLCEQVL